MTNQTDVLERTETKSKSKNKIAEPKKWKVILLNDDRTPVDFVIAVLISIFNHDPDTAYAITMDVHEKGSGVAGIYSFEIAEMKAIETIELARANSFPLQTKMEEIG